MARFFFSENYNEVLERIEDHILATTESLELVERFLDLHDECLRFIADNPLTPAIHPLTGDQTWVFGEGRYRIFFRAVLAEEWHIYLTHLIDNKEANLKVYPGNKIPTYEDD